MKKFLLVFLFSLVLNLCFSQWNQTKGPSGGIISALAYDPATKYIYAGTPSSGIFISKDNGLTWELIVNGITRENYVYSIFIKNSQVFAGTWRGAYISNDNGLNWTLSQNGFTSGVVRDFISVDDKIFATSPSQIHVSTNNGESWSPININDYTFYPEKFAASGNYVFAGGSGGVYRSENKGESWNKLNTGLNSNHVLCMTSHNGNIYAATQDGIYMMPANGNAWTLVSSSLNSSINSLMLINNEIYAGTNYGLFVSQNGATSWTLVQNGLPDKQIYSTIKVENSIFTASSEGLYYSNNTGTSWTETSEGLVNARIKNLTFSNSKIVAVSQIERIYSSTDNGETWNRLSDIPNSSINSIYQINNDLFASTNNGLFLSTDNGQNWLEKDNGIATRNITAIVEKENILFCGTDNGVYKSTDYGKNWTVINNGLTNLQVHSLIVHGNNLISGTSNQLFYSSDNGSSWLPYSLSGKNIKSIASNSSKILINTGNEVYLIQNEGSSWSLIYSDYNNIIESVQFYEENIFVGTSIGMFLSKNNGESWDVINNGFYMGPFCFSDKFIFSGTESGVWKREISETLLNIYAAPGYQSFNIRPNNIHAGQMSFDWNPGNGKARVIFVKEGSSGSLVPQDGTTYVANSEFGKGSKVNDWYCVYNGTGYRQTITGLKSNTTYKIFILEYNGSAGKEKYLTIESIRNPINETTKKGVAGLVEYSSYENYYSRGFSYKYSIELSGTESIKKHGICWATHASPNLNDSTKTLGSEIGIYKGVLGTLSPDTKYYARTFVTFASDTAYGDEFTFTTNDIPKSMESAYEMLMPPPYGYFTKDPNNWVYGSIAGGEANKGSETGDLPDINKIQRYEKLPNNPALEEKWNSMYEGIIRSNDALLTVKYDLTLNNSERDIKIGELHFLRAFYYFELIKVFGPKVPWIDEVNMYDPSSKENKIAIWNKVEMDFDTAINKLPDVSDNEGRVNVWAAKAFYAKLFLYQKKFAEAKTLFNDIITNGKTTSGIRYGLLANFENNFNISHNNNAESIFAQQPKLDGKNNHKANPGYRLMYPHGNNAPGGCCGFYQPSKYLVNSFKVDANGLPLFDPDHNTFPFNASDLKNDDGINSYESYTPDLTTTLDPRLDWTVGRRGIPYLDWGINPGKSWVRDQQSGGPYLPMKHVYRKTDEINGRTGKIDGWAIGSELNFNLMRFADVLLMAAECEVELGNLSRALTLVNQIRTRAANSKVQNNNADASNYQISTYSTFPNQQYAREAVRFERKLELAMEGHRFFDLSRWGAEYATQDLNTGYLAHESLSRTQFSGVVFDTCDLHFTIPQDVKLYLPPIKYLKDSAFSISVETPSGLPVSLSVSDTTVVKFINNKLHVIGLGVDTIKAYYSTKKGCISSSSDKQVIRILKRKQTLKFTELGIKHWGDVPITLRASASSGLPVSFSVKSNSIVKINGNKLEIVGIGSDTVYAIQPGDDIYDAVTCKRVIIVTKAAQTISFNIATEKRKGESPVALTANATSGLPVNFLVNDTSVLKISDQKVYFLHVGSDTIFAIQQGNEYFEAAKCKKLITVLKGLQNIAFDSIPPKMKGDAPLSLIASSSSGLPVTFSLKDTSVVKINNGNLYFLNAGTDTVFATQPGNDDYEAAPKTYRIVKVSINTKVSAIEKHQLQIYPNPTSGKLAIILPESIFSYTLTITDINGRKVFKEEYRNNSSQKVELDFTHLKAGTYFVKVEQGKADYLGKFIKN